MNNMKNIYSRELKLSFNSINFLKKDIITRHDKTLNFYQKNIKPKTQITTKKGWICKICGYIYEGEILPPDFICPICKHGAVDFEKI